MAADKNLGDKVSKLKASLDEIGEKLGSAGERLRDEVTAGVEQAVGWTEFAHAVAPVVEAASNHTLHASEVSRLLDDPSSASAAVVEARRRRDAFIASHGAEAWQAHLDRAGTLRIDRGPGRTVVTRISD